jgi:hypothetical protein
LGYLYYTARVRTETTDGTGLYAEKNINIVQPTTFMKVNPSIKEIISIDEDLLMFRNNTLELKVGDAGIFPAFIGDFGLGIYRENGYAFDVEVVSSNAKVASAYVVDHYRYPEIEEGATPDPITGIAYDIVLTALKKGNATITIKATDGSGKKASFKVRVK